MKFKLPPHLQQPRFAGSQWIAPPVHDGYGVFERPDSELPEIIRNFPGVGILSEELNWFRMPEGTTEISVEQQNFTADDNGYFQASVKLAPAILDLPGFNLIGNQQPSTKERPSERGRSRATRKPPRERPYWDRVRKIALEWLRENGIPEPGDGGQGRLEKHVGNWLAGRDDYPATSSLRTHVRRWIEEYRDNPLID